jgi:hypothetical protein
VHQKCMILSDGDVPRKVLLLYNFPNEPIVPTVDIDITSNEQFVDLLARYEKILAHVKKVNMWEILVVPL